MVLTALITGGMLILANILLAMFFFRLYKRQKAEILDVASRFFKAADTDTPSQFNVAINSISSSIAAAVVNQAKQTMYGQASGEARREKAVQGALAQDLIAQQSPALAAILQAFPAVNALVKKNPAMAGAAMNLIGSKMQKKGVKTESSGNGENLPVVANF